MAATIPMQSYFVTVFILKKKTFWQNFYLLLHYIVSGAILEDQGYTIMYVIGTLTLTMSSPGQNSM